MIRTILLALVFLPFLLGQATPHRYVLPVFDQDCKTLPRELCWRYAFMPQGWALERVVDHPWAYQLLAAPGTNPGLSAGVGIVLVQVENQPTQIMVDTSYMLYRLPDGSISMPMVGATCGGYGTGAIWLSAGGSLCFCTPDKTGAGFIWACGSLVMRGPD